MQVINYILSNYGDWKEISLEQAKFMFKLILNDYNRDMHTTYELDDLCDIHVRRIDDDYYKSNVEWAKELVKKRELCILDLLNEEDKIELASLEARGMHIVNWRYGSNVNEVLRHRDPNKYKDFLHSYHHRKDSFSGCYVVEVYCKSYHVDDCFNTFCQIVDATKYYHNKQDE